MEVGKLIIVKHTSKYEAFYYGSPSKIFGNSNDEVVINSTIAPFAKKRIHMLKENNYENIFYKNKCIQ